MTYHPFAMTHTYYNRLHDEHPGRGLKESLHNTSMYVLSLSCFILGGYHDSSRRTGALRTSCVITSLHTTKKIERYHSSRCTVPSYAGRWFGLSVYSKVMQSKMDDVLTNNPMKTPTFI